MTIKEKLKQYRTLKLELDEINDEINEKSVKGSVQGSMKDHPFILQNHTIGGVANEDYELLERKAEIKAKIKAVDDFVNGIDDSVVRKGITLKFMTIETNNKGKIKPPLKWFQVAQKINCGLSGDAIRIKIDRYLKNF